MYSIYKNKIIKYHKINTFFIKIKKKNIIKNVQYLNK